MGRAKKFFKFFLTTFIAGYMGRQTARGAQASRGVAIPRTGGAPTSARIEPH
jgi:hypothetical protein